MVFTRIKTVILVGLFFLVEINPLQAQQAIEPVKHLKGGITATRLLNTDWESSYVPGFTIGISLNFRFTQTFSVQPEVLYLEKGSRENVPSLNTEFNLMIDYAEVPLLAKYHLPANGIFQPHIYAGPYASFLIENNSNIEIVDPQESTPDKLVEDASTSDFGAVVGIGTDLDFTFNTMSAEIRYSTGFSDVFKDASTQTAQNSAFMLIIGFNF